MPKRTLNDRTLKALKPAATGKRVEIWDTLVPGFGVRVTDTGRKTFVLVARYGGNRNPTRRALGEYGELTLEKAREKARDWLQMIRAGRDPAGIEEQQRQAAIRDRDNIFAAAADAFVRYIKRQKLRTAAEMERDLRTVFVARWGKRAITEISANDIKKVISEAVEREAPYRAFKLWALIRRMFNWAIGTDDYGLEVNPIRRLSQKDVIGERQSRDRVLTNDELRALWRVAGRWGYPYGPLYRLLVLSGVRLNELCGARWGEIDLQHREWTIPSERMKKVRGGAKPHVVPLNDVMIEILGSLPRCTGGDHVFSFSFGKRPLKPNQFSEPKAKLDRMMLRTLRAIARMRGEDPKRVTLPDWINHDLRRNVRTGLSSLRVPEEVREAVLAHVRPGIKGTYDKYEYLDEKREALTLWAARLRSIVDLPPADNVVRLPAPVAVKR